MEYVAKRKLTLAGKALLETQAAVIDIALGFGYDSREGFTRSFKAYMGVSPSEFRRYGLNAISQKTIKELPVLMYAKNTDEIIRELNEFIADAKEAAGNARKQKELVEYIPFWNIIADTTDNMADKAKKILDSIATIAEHPDEITKRFLILKVLEDIGFQSNLVAFNAGLMVSRDIPERTSKQWPMCELFFNLARSASLKNEKIAGLFRELTALILQDMRKTAEVKISGAASAGKSASDSIEGYGYIKEEVARLADMLAVPVETIDGRMLEDCLFRLDIIMFAAEMDVFRNPKTKTMFDKLKQFKKSLIEAIDFFSAYAKPDVDPNTSPSMDQFAGNSAALAADGADDRTLDGIDDRAADGVLRKRFLDIAYQGNVLLFYLRGEVSHEKLGHLLDESQKTAFNVICDKVGNFILIARNASEESAFMPIAEMLYAIHSAILIEAVKLNELGSAIKYLADEFRCFGDAVAAYAPQQITAR